MVTLAYLTRNMSLEFMPLPVKGECVSLPEDLIFVAYMDGTTIVKEPLDSVLEFSKVERLIMGLSAFDLSFVKDSDFRKQNTKICPRPVEKVAILTNVSVTGFTPIFPADVSNRMYTCSGMYNLSINRQRFDNGSIVVTPLDYYYGGHYAFPLSLGDQIWITDNLGEFEYSEVQTVS
ncbi:hypothetical protein [Flavobacterium sp. ZB4P13]|uniref:hypothetical protein n=1 Tax=Flavobacterium sp. ZB4P13 TaxID=3401728 RepID=UPI003AB0C083